MSLLSSILLGLVQGIAEFLPISSSGHLAIAEHLLNVSGATEIPDFFDVLLHLGTLVAVFVAYWSDIRDMILELISGVRDLGPPQHAGSHPARPPDDPAHHRGHAAAVFGAAGEGSGGRPERQHVFCGRRAAGHRLPALCQ